MAEHSSTTERRIGGLVRRVAAALAVLAATVAAVTLATGAPAQAATSVRYCFPIHDRTGAIIEFHCIDVPYAYDPRPCRCGDFAIDIVGDPGLAVEAQHRYLDHVERGVVFLRQAAWADDPVVADRLRDDALAAFRSAGESIGTVGLRLGPVGLPDFPRRRIDPQPNPWVPNQPASDPQPDPWLESTAYHLVAGLRLVQQARSASDPSGLLAEAMTEFEAGGQGLATPG